MGNEIPSQHNEDSKESSERRDAILKLKHALAAFGDVQAQRKLILNANDINDGEFIFNLDYVIPHAKFALENDANIAAIRQQIVPAMVSEDEFWKRYFYILHQFKQNNYQIMAKSLPPPPAEKHCTGASQPHPSQSDLNTSNESKSDSKNGTLSSQTQTNTTKNTDSAKHDHHSKNSKHKHKHKRDKRESKSNTSDAATDSKESLEHEPFEILLRKREIWLYRIPPNIWRSNRNNSAKQWNLREPLWTGHLRIVAFDHGNEIIFEFLNKNNSIYLQSVRIPLKKIILSQMSSNDTRIQKVSLTEESLANASSTSDGSILNLHDYFDAYGVIDSSRYFIIWVETPNIDEKLRKRIPLGFGMRERHDAFDIRAAVTDQLRRVKNSLNINGSNDGSKGSDASDDSDNGSGGSLEDDLSNIKLTEMFTLKENEMIAIGNHHKGNKSRIVTKSMETNENKNNKLDLNKLLLLPPPPEKKVVAIDTTQAPKSMAQVQQETVGSITNETEEETNIADWGDFQAATGSNDNDNEKEMIETNVSNDKKKEQEMEVANNSTE